jgi:hypothetical protein
MNVKKKEKKGAVNFSESIDLFYRLKHHKNYTQICSHGRHSQPFFGFPSYEGRKLTRIPSIFHVHRAFVQ